MDAPKPNIEDQAGSPVINKARLEATNSQIGNASQVVNSPGAVVNQTVTQIQPPPGPTRTELILWSLMALALLVVASRATISLRVPGEVAQVIVGCVLGGITWKFFERVEVLLTEQAKFEIAVWLLGVRISQRVPWPDTFAKVFDRVFGTKRLSLKCFARSCVLSVFGIVTAQLIWPSLPLLSVSFGSWFGYCYVLPIWFGVDYLSLLKTRWSIRELGGYGESSYLPNTYRSAAFLLLDLCYTAVLLLISWGLLPLYLWLPNVISTAITSIWLWLYAGSGFLLKAARRFDIGFDLFNRKFDIEKKPLQSIGLVAGALVAVVYWTAVIVGRWV